MLRTDQQLPEAFSCISTVVLKRCHAEVCLQDVLCHLATDPVRQKTEKDNLKNDVVSLTALRCACLVFFLLLYIMTRCLTYYQN